jgi:UDP-2,3-diacylglucosamine pyrophosphatase LpxH
MADPQEYQRDVSAGLDRVYGDAATEEQVLDVRTARVVVFSDMHKGTRDGADDFLRCERAYAAALGSYLERGYRLLVLGDAEELWENRPEGVLAAYDDVLRLEADFHRAGCYERFWGNHDDEWRYAGQVRKRLGRFFPGLRVREALKVRVRDGDADLGLLFLVHGHQGTLDSDRLSWLSRLFVRYVWRNVQRLAHISLNTPSRDYALAELHDTAMFTWARDHPDRPVLIAGHTHHPIFGTSRPAQAPLRDIAEIEHDLDAARRATPADVARVAALRAELEFVRAEGRRRGPPTIPVVPPCYFNTGCCCFGDGDVTGLEIADGEIRLVRWPDDDGRPQPRVLARADLRDVLRTVATATR